MVARARLMLFWSLQWALFGLLLGLRVGGIAGRELTIAERFPTGVLRVGIDPSYPPFATHQPAGFAGFDVDLAEALATELGIPLQLVPLGYDGLYDALRTESIDLLLAGVHIDYRRSEDVIYSAPYWNAGLLLLSPLNDPLLGREELPARRIAYAYGSEADRYLWYAERELAPFQRAPYENAMVALRALQRGHADAALVEGIAGRLFLREHGSWAKGVALSEELLAMAMRRDRPLIHEVIHTALAALKSTGRLQEILARWF